MASGEPTPSAAAMPHPATALALAAAAAVAAAADAAAPAAVPWGRLAAALVLALPALSWPWSRARLPPWLPALALLAPWSGWVGFALAAGLALAATAALALRPRPPEPTPAAAPDEHLRVAAEAERGRLVAHIARYPELQEASLELAGARDLNQLASALCARAGGLVVGAREVAVFLGRGRDLQCLAAVDGAGEACERPPGDEELFVAIEARPLTLRADGEVRALLPLRGDRRRDGDADALRGALALRFAAKPGDEGPALELLAALARLGGLGLAAVDLLEQARTLALRDDLTGLYGRHEFLRRMHEQVAASRRGHVDLGVVVCDMDHLKRFNDRYGHPAGDSALKSVAHALSEGLPPGAVICRWGGEEFAALIPGADAQTTGAAAEALRAAIAAALPDPAHPDRRLTASVGWTVLHPQEPGTAALTRADAACYRAKTGGRNRCEGEP